MQHDITLSMIMPLWEWALAGQVNPAETLLTPLQSFLAYNKEYFVMQPGTSVQGFLLISCPQIQNWEQCIICLHDWEQMELNNWNVSFVLEYLKTYVSCNYHLKKAFVTGASFRNSAALCKYCNSEKNIFWECRANPIEGIRKQMPNR